LPADLPGSARTRHIQTACNQQNLIFMAKNNGGDPQLLETSAPVASQRFFY
jgi:hypothetical protein